ncbi:MAG: hypothetical protein H6746_05055 [Deltaproteobacteria bacterium]|nr:hypothetical protein [Deltaproteobacteria bacterium]
MPDGTDAADDAVGPGLLVVSPNPVDFGFLAPESASEVPLVLRNAGGQPITVTSYTLTGSSAFTLIRVDTDGARTERNASPTTAKPVELHLPVALAPGESTDEFRVGFHPHTPDGAQGTLRFLTAGSSGDPEGVVELRGNLGGPCITLSPASLELGGAVVGTQVERELELSNCSEDLPLTISSVSLLPGAAPGFSVDAAGLTPGGGAAPSAEAPVVLAPGVSGVVVVRYQPTTLSATDATGELVPDLGTLRVVTDAGIANRDVPLRGFGVASECPIAVIRIQEGAEVPPQTRLHLDGLQSIPVGSSLKRFEWSVEQPDGSVSGFLPSFRAPQPTFEANVAGEYLVRLRVFDAQDNPSCGDAVAQVQVTPDAAVHIELLWDTPGDPDQSDEGPEAGADLDLHFALSAPDRLDPTAGTEPWFGMPHDSYWYNADPNWGDLDPAIDDNPHVDRDDTDGAGPEIINLAQPEEGKNYRLGVHYWSDHDFGPSTATVRVYVHGALQAELNGVTLEDRELWDVGTLHWPSGEVTPTTGTDGGPKITPDYPTPFPTD